MKDKKTRELLDTVIQSANYMKDLILKTLRLARLNTPSTKIQLEKVDLLEELNRVLERNKTLFKEHNIEVENLLDDNIVVDADKLYLEELFENLLSNAVKYTPDGGKIIIKGERGGDEVKISIKDTGIGMTEEQIKRIFDEFYKADSSRHNLDSSGLGLSIAKRIVEKHGGRIWAESPGKGKGSTFYFTLPVKRDK